MKKSNNCTTFCFIFNRIPSCGINWCFWYFF